MLKKSSKRNGLRMNTKESQFLAGIIRSVLLSAALIVGMGRAPAFAQMATPDSSPPAAKSDPGVTTPGNSNAEIFKELQQMRARIAELEAQLKAQQAGGQPAVINATTTNAQPPVMEASISLAKTASTTQTAQTKTDKEKPSEPFAFADWT